MSDIHVNKLGFMMEEISRAAENGNAVSKEQLEEIRKLMQHFAEFSSRMQDHYQKVINDLVSEQQNQETDYSYCIDVLKDNMGKWKNAGDAMEDQLNRISGE